MKSMLVKVHVWKSSILVPQLLILPLNLLHYLMFYMSLIFKAMLYMSPNYVTLTKFRLNSSLFHFSMKDLSTGASLMKGLSLTNLYELPRQLLVFSTAAIALLSVKASVDLWHNKLGLPFSKILVICLCLTVYHLKIY